MTTVDDYVKTNVAPEFQNIVTMLRQLMQEIAPDAEELIRYGMPVYRGKRIFAWISATKNDITFAFSRGVQFEDRYRLLRGAAKSSRHVKLKNSESVNKEALEYYVRQALMLDQK